jgi:hypothetical protein
MATPKKPTVATDDRISAFPVPFSLDAFRKDILEVFFHYVRIIGWITDEKTASQVMGFASANPGYLFDPEWSTEDHGLNYERVRGTQFAVALEHLYEFAFFGRRDLSAESMEYESYYMWVSDLVLDAFDSSVSEQWGSYGGMVSEHAKNCLLVAETANARVILEGDEPFSYFNNGKSRVESASEGVLTIRQMALLSGMEEMSIRAAANKKRVNPLKTHALDGGTRIAVDVAKDWLRSKGRYVPIEIYRSAGNVDLSKRGFADYQDLWHALNARCLMIADRDGLDLVKEKLAVLNLRLAPGVSDYLDIDDAAYANEPLIRLLADLLELPADLLVLRCKETVANEQLAAIGRQIKQALVATDSLTSA